VCDGDLSYHPDRVRLESIIIHIYMPSLSLFIIFLCCCCCCCLCGWWCDVRSLFGGGACRISLFYR